MPTLRQPTAPKAPHHPQTTAGGSSGLPDPVEELVATLTTTVPSHVVQSIRAMTAHDLQAAAAKLQHQFLFADLVRCTTKQQVLAEIGQQFPLPEYYGRNLDALYDCLTDSTLKTEARHGFIIVLEHLPTSSRLSNDMREQILDVFRDAADFWAEKDIPFRCFYSFY